MITKMIVPQEKIRDPLIHKKISKTPVNIDSIEGMKPSDNKKVYGEFINLECPGQPAFVCCKYHSWHPYFSRNFKDGEKCTIGLIEARHINERCKYKKHSHILDEKGNPVKDENSEYPRYKFIIEKYL
jgi:hypothetical protein